MYRFDLESAIAAWRHSLDLHPVFLEEDLDELEQHLRDHVEALTAAGVDVEAAYRTAAGRLGAHGDLETAYRRVRFGRSKRRRALSNASAWGLIMLKNYLVRSLRYE